MPVEELTLPQIRELYQTFQAEDPWPEWHSRYESEVRHFRDLDPERFRSPDAQERLWRARRAASAGQGEFVDVRGAYTDPKVVDLFAQLRSGKWPEEQNARARAIQDAYDQILNLVVPRHSKTRPQAKLGRAFAVLLPHDTCTGFSYDSRRHIVRLLLGARPVQPTGGGVLVRARLREALGPEPDLAEHVRRSTFCWWLHLRFDRLIRGEFPVSSEPAPPPPVDQELPKLVVWPITKQYKGLTAVSGYVESYRAVVGAARGGATPDDIVAALRTQFGLTSMSPDSCRSLFNRVRLLGFLEHRDGLWHPSADGEQLVEDDPPDVLVDKLLVQTFGLGHLLVSLQDHGPQAPTALAALLREKYPRWTTDFTPNSIAGWAESLGLVDRMPDGRRTLTDYGRSWVARLPSDLPAPATDPGPDPVGTDSDADSSPASESTAWPTLAQLTARFRDEPELRGMVFSDEQLRALHLAWHCHPRKRFVVLSGLSGTGKTALLVHYARLYCALANADPRRHVEVVPVAPDWRDPSGLFGYFNALHANPTFQAEPALRLVIAAARDPGRPYFLILDEMNLARVEQYFAPMLSAMEIPSGKLVLHSHDEPINGVPPAVPWPTNLFVGGTVNMDETTHPFSDKVLDRAFTLEFWDVDLPAFLKGRPEVGRHPEAEALLVALNTELRRVRRHFGYRTAGEVLAYLDHAHDAGILDGASRAALTDDAVFAKVLPRIRGEDTPELHQALTTLESLVRDAGLTRSVAKLQQMRDRLHGTGLTRFWA